jgi:hypothetical protein
MVTVAAGVAALTIAACGAGAANGPAPVVQPANGTFSTNVPTTVVVPPPQLPLSTNPAPVAPAVPTTRGRGVEPGDDHGGNCALEPNDDRCLRAGAGGAGANGAGTTRAGRPSRATTTAATAPWSRTTTVVCGRPASASPVTTTVTGTPSGATTTAATGTVTGAAAVTTTTTATTTVVVTAGTTTAESKPTMER